MLLHAVGLVGTRMFCLVGSWFDHREAGYGSFEVFFLGPVPEVAVCGQGLTWPGGHLLVAMRGPDGWKLGPCASRCPGRAPQEL